MRSVIPVLLALSAHALGCGSSDEPAESTPDAMAPSEPPNAIQSAYAALTEGSTDGVADLVSAVDAMVAEDPDNGMALLYSGVMRLWQFGENVGLSSDPVVVLGETEIMIERLEQARELLPDDDRVEAFLGLSRASVGNVINDTAKVDQGLAELDEAVARFPAYAHFLRALARSQAPRDSQEFAQSIADMRAVVESCGLSADDTGVLEYPEGELPREIRVCNDEGIVPHVWEGFLITYGDLLVKAGGDLDAARAVYQSATRSPAYVDWPFAPELEERIATAEQRSAQYADADPANDPPLWNATGGHICIGCHQARP